MQEPPGIIQDLTEPLFDPFRKTKSNTKQQGHAGAGPRSTNHEIKPSDEISHPGTTKISRSDTPPTSDGTFPYEAASLTMIFRNQFKKHPNNTNENK